jgi:hypothetical protein
MLRRPILAVTLFALALPACSGNRHIVKTGERTYRLRCETSLSACLEQADSPCHQGFEVREGKDVRSRSGIDAVGTGTSETRSSEAVVVCRSDALLGDEDTSNEDDSRPRLLREQICTPGSSQACVGPGGCAGGQACLGDGTGYDRCDCGGPPPPMPSTTPSAAASAPPAASMEVPPPAPSHHPVPAPSGSTPSGSTPSGSAPSGSAAPRLEPTPTLKQDTP